MNIEFKKANIYDVDKLINIQNESLYDDYIKYGKCPGDFLFNT